MPGIDDHADIGQEIDVDGFPIEIYRQLHLPRCSAWLHLRSHSDTEGWHGKGGAMVPVDGEGKFAAQCDELGHRPERSMGHGAS